MAKDDKDPGTGELPLEMPSKPKLKPGIAVSTDNGRWYDVVRWVGSLLPGRASVNLSEGEGAKAVDELIRRANEDPDSVDAFRDREREERSAEPVTAPPVAFVKRGRPAKPRQLDMLVVPLTDVPLRDQRDTMAAPFFSLTKNKRTQPIDFRNETSFVRVEAGASGMATIWDYDIMIWAASILNAQREGGEPLNPKIAFHPYDLLQAIRPGASPGGVSYGRLEAALNRLTDTTVQTNMQVPDGELHDRFHWVERWGGFKTKEGEPKKWWLQVPTWFVKQIEAGRVLAIDPHYFDLEGGYERWLYRFARKSAGGAGPNGWTWDMRELHRRSGTTREFKKFAADIRRIAKLNELPEFDVTVYEGQRGAEQVHFRRNPAKCSSQDKRLSADTVRALADDR
jgi:plasmid replication initiation protein